MKGGSRLEFILKGLPRPLPPPSKPAKECTMAHAPFGEQVAHAPFGVQPEPCSGSVPLFDSKFRDHR